MSGDFAIGAIIAFLVYMLLDDVVHYFTCPHCKRRRYFARTGRILHDDDQA